MSAANVTEVCALTYSQLAPSIRKWLPEAQACTEGSTKKCSVRSTWIRSRACWKAAPARPSTIPRTTR